jgi:ferredoxin-NADP reductase
VKSATGATETVEPRAPLRWRTAVLTASRAETATAVTLEFAIDGWPGHRAGQHVDLRLTADDGYQAQRSYSIASPPEAGALELTIERIADGEVSPYLVDVMKPGDELELRGPVGGWFVWDVEDGGPLLLIAGGSGLVPLMAMLRHRAGAASRVPARLLVSARSLDDLIYAKEIERLTAGDEDLEIFKTLTRSAPAGWPGYTRRIDRAMLAEVAWAPEELARTFVCGPTAFVEAAADGLVGLGHDPALIKTERFGPTGG